MFLMVQPSFHKGTPAVAHNAAVHARAFRTSPATACYAMNCIAERKSKLTHPADRRDAGLVFQVDNAVCRPEQHLLLLAPCTVDSLVDVCGPVRADDQQGIAV
jgi:hypothetical protein